MSMKDVVEQPWYWLELDTSVTSANLVGNDNVMSSWYNNLGLLLKSPKKCAIGRNFSFWYIWVAWWKCVACSHNMTLDILQDFYDFFMWSNAKKFLGIFGSRTWKFNPVHLMHRKKVRYFLIPQICNACVSILHCKIIKMNSLLFLSICGKFSFFIFWPFHAHKINLG